MKTYLAYLTSHVVRMIEFSKYKAKLNLSLVISVDLAKYTPYLIR